MPTRKCTRTSRQPGRKLCRYQRGGFLNRYNFANASRDTVNTTMNRQDTTVPKLIKQTLDEVNRQARIRRLLNDGRQKIEKIAPKIIRGAIEDVRKTPFRILGNFFGRERSLK